MIAIDVAVVDATISITVIEIHGFHAPAVRRVTSMFAKALTGCVIVIRIVALRVIVAGLF